MNTIETATIIQSELDKAAVEQATSGWMEVNEKLVKYTGWCGGQDSESRYGRNG